MDLPLRLRTVCNGKVLYSAVLHQASHVCQEAKITGQHLEGKPSVDQGLANFNLWADAACHVLLKAGVKRPVWPPKPKIFTTWPFRAKTCQFWPTFQTQTNHITNGPGPWGGTHLGEEALPPCPGHLTAFILLSQKIRRFFHSNLVAGSGALLPTGPIPSPSWRL